MLTDGAGPWESAGGHSPLCWLKALVCPCHRSLQCRAPARLLRRSACDRLPARPRHLTPQTPGIQSGVGSCLGFGLCCSLAAPLPLPHALGEAAPLLPGASPTRAVLPRDPCPTMGRGFQHGETPGWGAAPLPRRKQEQRSAGGNLEQVVQELVVIFKHGQLGQAVPSQAGGSETTLLGHPGQGELLVEPAVGSCAAAFIPFAPAHFH